MDHKDLTVQETGLFRPHTPTTAALATLLNLRHEITGKLLDIGMRAAGSKVLWCKGGSRRHSLTPVCWSGSYLASY